MGWISGSNSHAICIIICISSFIIDPIILVLCQDEKDRKIQELTLELRNKRRLCAAYKEQLTAFLEIIEEHSEQITMKVQNVMNNLKEYESV